MVKRCTATTNVRARGTPIPTGVYVPVPAKSQAAETIFPVPGGVWASATSTHRLARLDVDPVTAVGAQLDHRLDALPGGRAVRDGDDRTVGAVSGGGGWRDTAFGPGAHVAQGLVHAVVPVDQIGGTDAVDRRCVEMVGVVVEVHPELIPGSSVPQGGFDPLGVPVRGGGRCVDVDQVVDDHDLAGDLPGVTGVAGDDVGRSRAGERAVLRVQRFTGRVPELVPSGVPVARGRQVVPIEGALGEFRAVVDPDLGADLQRGEHGGGVAATDGEGRRGRVEGARQRADPVLPVGRVDAVVQFREVGHGRHAGEAQRGWRRALDRRDGRERVDEGSLDEAAERAVGGAEVAGLGPEVVDVGRIRAVDPAAGERVGRCRRAEDVVGVLPAGERHAEGGQLPQHGALGPVEPGVRVPAAAGTDRVGDLFGLVGQHPLGEGADREDVRGGHRCSDDERHEPVPDAGGVLGRADGLEGATARPVQVAVDRPVAGVVVGGGHGLGELGGGGGVPVAERHEAAGLHGVAAAGRSELDGAVRRLLVGEGVGVLEEATLPLVRGRQVDGESDVRAVEVSRHPVVDRPVWRDLPRCRSLDGRTSGRRSPRSPAPGPESCRTPGEQRWRRRPGRPA